jgi:hypothetical protein
MALSPHEAAADSDAGYRAFATAWAEMTGLDG